jgi:glutamate-1-semialdehyde aminotransferase
MTTLKKSANLKKDLEENEKGTQTMRQTPKTQASFGPFKPVSGDIIRTQSSTPLSDIKKGYLNAFIEHYCGKNSRSKAFARRYRPVYADQRAVSFFHIALKELCFPLVLSHAEGSRIWDIDGNEYIDIAMDFGPNMFGHQAPFLKNALIDQINKGLALSMRPEKSAMAAELLCELTGMERAVFTQSGTEAVMTAVRLARQVTGRKKIVIFTGSYHGHSDGVLAYSFRENGKNITKPIVSATPQGMVDDVVVLDYATTESLEAIRSMGRELAAVLVEPMQSRGLHQKPREFLRELRGITAENDTALIFDEMITGLRTAPGGAQELFDIKADIATYGKVLGGGIGLGAIAGKATYLDAIDGGVWDYGDSSFPETERTFFAGTHSQNTLAMTAAYAVLTFLKEQGPGL